MVNTHASFRICAHLQLLDNTVKFCIYRQQNLVDFPLSLVGL